MLRATVDPCFFIRRKERRFMGLTALQVDDSLTLVDESFLVIEGEAAKKLKTKHRVIIEEKPIAFNGIRIRRRKDGLLMMHQTDKIEKLAIPSTQQKFNRKRAPCQYIGVKYCPDTAAAIQLVAAGAGDTTKEDKKF